jgi:hypothetical protein
MRLGEPFTYSLLSRTIKIRESFPCPPGWETVWIQCTICIGERQQV